ncbi:MAG TPA: hypothetical protein PKI47_07170 [Fervidobacterium sp.]|mgnify:CR=1 FL=1|nr:hypothetical protein [Fervidobacterium sp.]
MIDRGQIYKLFEQGRYEDVLTFFSKNLPQIPDDYNLKALSLYNIGLVQEAVEILRYGLTAFPQNKDLLFNMIEILYTAREYEEVKKYLERAIEIEPENYVYYDIFATILFSENKNYRALQYAQKALKYAPTSVYDELIDKYSRLERTLSIRHENIPNAKRIKRMLLIGLPHNYLDSFKYFLEDDWEIYVIKAQNWTAFGQDYEFMENIGARIISRLEVATFLESMGSKIDLIIRIGNFYAGNDLYHSYGDVDIDQMDTFFKISAILKKRNQKTKAILAFSGGSFFFEQRWNDWLRSRIGVCDYILFETRNLRDYFISKVDKDNSLDRSKLRVIRVSLPDSRDLFIDFHEHYTKRIVAMGKSLKSYTPISNIFVDEIGEDMKVGKGKSCDGIDECRSRFLARYGKYAFGLGYFYDFYDRKQTFGELLASGNLDSVLSNTLFNPYPLIYGFINIPIELITYLQFGIVPVIPNDENDFHRELIDNGMAIGVSKDTLFFDPNTYSDKTITEMRKNIGKHATIFTFDAFYNFVEALTEGRDVR